MAAMTTVLTEFSDNGNSRTYTQAGHTAQKAALVIQKRKVPSGPTSNLEDTVSVVHATEDSDGLVLSSRVVFTATVRRPLAGDAADIAAALAVFRDVVASDEFTSMVDTQNFVS